MNKVRELLAKLPELSGCQDADRFAERNLMIFDKELENKKSVFAHRNTDKGPRRLRVLDIDPGLIEKPLVYSYGMTRILIVSIAGDIEKGRATNEDKETLDLMIKASNEQKVTPEMAEIDAILPLEQAARGVWSG